MSAEQNIETARQMYQAFGRGDVRAILDRVTGDVDWSTDAAIVSAPWYGPRHGKDGVVSFFEAIGTTGPVTEFTPLALRRHRRGGRDGVHPLRVHGDRNRQARRDEHASLPERMMPNGLGSCPDTQHVSLSPG